MITWEADGHDFIIVYYNRNIFKYTYITAKQQPVIHQGRFRPQTDEFM